MRSRVNSLACCVRWLAIHASGSKSARDRCASVSLSTLSFFNRADAIAFTRCGCTITSRSASGPTARANAGCASTRRYRRCPGPTARANAGQNPLASTTTCRGPGTCRSQTRSASAWLTTRACLIVLPLASNAVK
jgi:hypothetical protein